MVPSTPFEKKKRRPMGFPHGNKIISSSSSSPLLSLSLSLSLSS
jgi:hypothetical protein